MYQQQLDRQRESRYRQFPSNQSPQKAVASTDAASTIASRLPSLTTASSLPVAQLQLGGRRVHPSSYLMDKIKESSSITAERPIKPSSSSIATTSEQKLSYLFCNEIGHEMNQLNMVCLEPTCEKRGLICCMCLPDHSSHHQSYIAIQNVVSQLQSIAANGHHLHREVEAEENLRSEISADFNQSFAAIDHFKEFINNYIQTLQEFFKSAQEEAFARLKQELSEGSLHRELKEFLEKIDVGSIIGESLNERKHPSHLQDDINKFLDKVEISAVGSRNVRLRASAIPVVNAQTFGDILSTVKSERQTLESMIKKLKDTIQDNNITLTDRTSNNPHSGLIFQVLSSSQSSSDDDDLTTLSRTGVLELQRMSSSKVASAQQPSSKVEEELMIVQRRLSSKATPTSCSTVHEPISEEAHVQKKQPHKVTPQQVQYKEDIDATVAAFGNKKNQKIFKKQKLKQGLSQSTSDIPPRTSDAAPRISDFPHKTSNGRLSSSKRLSHTSTATEGSDILNRKRHTNDLQKLKLVYNTQSRESDSWEKLEKQVKVQEKESVIVDSDDEIHSVAAEEEEDLIVSQLPPSQAIQPITQSATEAPPSLESKKTMNEEITAPAKDGILTQLPGSSKEHCEQLDQMAVDRDYLHLDDDDDDDDDEQFLIQLSNSIPFSTSTPKRVEKDDVDNLGEITGGKKDTFETPPRNKRPAAAAAAAGRAAAEHEQVKGGSTALEGVQTPITIESTFKKISPRLMSPQQSSSSSPQQSSSHLNDILKMRKPVPLKRLSVLAVEVNQSQSGGRMSPQFSELSASKEYAKNTAEPISFPPPPPLMTFQQSQQPMPDGCFAQRGGAEFNEDCLFGNVSSSPSSPRFSRQMEGITGRASKIARVVHSPNNLSVLMMAEHAFSPESAEKSRPLDYSPSSNSGSSFGKQHKERSALERIMDFERDKHSDDGHSSSVSQKHVCESNTAAATASGGEENSRGRSRKMKRTDPKGFIKSDQQPAAAGKDN